MKNLLNLDTYHSTVNLGLNHVNSKI